VRAVFYAVNGLGLGHVTRLLAIARALRRGSPDAEVLFVTSSEACQVIFKEGFAAVKVPSKTAREQLGLARSRYLRVVQSVTWAAISGFDPDVLVVDTYPSGSFDELLPVLRWRQKNVFVFREQREEAAAAPLMQATLPLYDLVLVPHAEASAVGPVPEPHKLKAVGPILIRERQELPTRAAARARLGLSMDAAALYVSFGGGGEPELQRAFDETLKMVAKHGPASLQVVVGGGPLGSASIAGVKQLNGIYPALDVLPAFDAAICAAGYNTAHEALFAGLPTVFIPFTRVLDDQEARARAIEAAGAGRLAASPSELGPQLAAVLDPTKAAAMRHAMARLVTTNGATAAAAAIAELAR
jgi:UDP:flavonoid glycosyltransferase YjiC (YdhE family)